MEKKQGFLLTVKKRHFVLCTDKKNVTDAIIGKFIDKIAVVDNLCDDLVERAKNDESFKKDMRKRLAKISVTEISENHIQICGEGMLLNYPNYDNIILFN